jgi:hypothetical protein
MTTLGTPKKWPLFIGGLYLEVVQTKLVGLNLGWALFTDLTEFS